MLACLIWRRDGRDADAAWQAVLAGEIDFDLNEMLASMAKAAEDAQKEAEAAAAAEKDAVSPTPAGSAPAGSATTGSGTPESSPSTSGSARSKSASSKSRTSRL
jgi:hypothetical protein